LSVGVASSEFCLHWLGNASPFLNSSTSPYIDVSPRCLYRMKQPAKVPRPFFCKDVPVERLQERIGTCRIVEALRVPILKSNDPLSNQKNKNSIPAQSIKMMTRISAKPPAKEHTKKYFFTLSSFRVKAGRAKRTGYTQAMTAMATRNPHLQ